MNGRIVSAQEAFLGAPPKFESLIGDAGTVTITVAISGASSGQLDFFTSADSAPKLIHFEVFENLSGPLTITAPAKLDETVHVSAHRISPPMFSESQEISLNGRDLTVALEMKEREPPPPGDEQGPPAEAAAVVAPPAAARAPAGSAPAEDAPAPAPDAP